MKVSLRIEGGRELNRTLNSLSKRVSKQIQRQALRDAAEPMRQQMSRFAPRAPGEPDLADNMVVSNALKRDGLSDTEVGVRVGPARGFFYAYFQEWGTSRHGAQPFMRPAFDGSVRDIVTFLMKRLWTELAGRGISRPTQHSDGPVSGGPGGSVL